MTPREGDHFPGMELVEVSPAFGSPRINNSLLRSRSPCGIIEPVAAQQICRLRSWKVITVGACGNRNIATAKLVDEAKMPAPMWLPPQMMDNLMQFIG